MFDNDESQEDLGHFTDENGRKLTFDEMMADTAVKHANSLARDPEWSNKITIHFHTVINAFAIGVMTSYPYYKGYRHPPNFELVCNRMAYLLSQEFDNQICDYECIEVSLLKLKGVYKRLAMSIKEYVEWNDIGSPEGDGIVTRYDSTQRPSFIDLDVPPHNAVIYLRNEERNHKRFEEEFEKKYGKLGDENELES